MVRGAYCLGNRPGQALLRVATVTTATPTIVDRIRRGERIGQSSFAARLPSCVADGLLADGIIRWPDVRLRLVYDSGNELAADRGGERIETEGQDILGSHHEEFFSRALTGFAKPLLFEYMKR